MHRACTITMMIKTVGRRRVDRNEPGALQHTLAAVRATGAVVPRGVYRFSSFEEADAWMTRTMARTHANLRSRVATSLTVDGVAIPIASPATLIRTKNTT